MSTDIELPDAEDVRDRFSRRVAILIVVGTLAGAFVGFLQTTADRKANEAGVAAQRNATQSMGALLRSQQAAQVDFENYALSDMQVRRSAASQQQYFFLFGDFEAAAKLAQNRWQQLATQTATLTKITADRPDGPVLDPGFPREYFANSTRDAIFRRALQDAANEEDGAWSAKESTYTAILTLFAVALYLLGLSLTVKLGIRRMFAVLGLVLILVGSTWAALVAVDVPEAPSTEAAEAFADGHVALQAAGTPAQYLEAVEFFDQAIEKRPTFALAYQERSEAAFAAGAPPGQGLLSVSTKEATESSTLDLQQALDLGLANHRVLGSLGFQEFLLGLQDRSQARLEAGLEHTRAAIELDRDDPIGWFNEGVTLLALGREDEARTAYEQAMRTTIYTDAETGELREDAYTEELYAAGALTDLELLVEARPEMADTVRALKDEIVTAVAMHTLEPGAEPEAIPSIEIDVFPAELQWTAELPGYDPEADVVTQQWYYRGPQKLGWAALPAVSGQTFPVALDVGYYSLRSYLAATSPPACLSTGTYRVEIYLNGRLAGTAEVDDELPELTGYVPRDLNAGLCRPTDWVRSDLSIPGWYDGFVGPDGDRGVYVFRYTPPRGDTGFDALDTTVRIFGHLFPGEGAPVFDPDEGTDTDFFLGLEDPRKRWYDFPGGFVRAGAGKAADGAVFVALVFGPEDFMSHPGEDGLAIFDSLIEFEPLG